MDHLASDSSSLDSSQLRRSSRARRPSSRYGPYVPASLPVSAVAPISASPSSSSIPLVWHASGSSDAERRRLEIHLGKRPVVEQDPHDLPVSRPRPLRMRPTVVPVPTVHGVAAASVLPSPLSVIGVDASSALCLLLLRGVQR